MSRRSPFVLLIMDGWGVASPWGGNATTIARTPFISTFWQQSPRAILGAAEQSVGLPKGERGNSEVGHLNIGSGQVAHQDLPSISATIEDGSFFNNSVLTEAMKTVKENNSQLHLIGLVSDGGVHSHITHLVALLDMAKKVGVPKSFIHLITDGRDSSPMDALKFIQIIEAKVREVPGSSIATVMGRFYAMDRELHWDRIEKAYKAITEGVGIDANSAMAAVSESYRNNKTDEFILPTVIRSSDQTVRSVKDNDVIVFFNFRADRARELTQALVQPHFSGFHRSVYRKDIKFITFTSYQEGLPVQVAFQPKEIHEPIAKVISDNGWRQFHIAETTKYAHVTYFFNGGIEKPFKFEDRLMVSSPKVAGYDQKPEMSAYQVASEVISRLKSYEFILVNFANPDMVGHTGNMRAAVKACEVVDECVGKILEAIRKCKGDLIITADHGNVEQMVNPVTGSPDTEHTINPVPFFFISYTRNIAIRQSGILADIAPTILEFMGLKIPAEMTGKSLIVGDTKELQAEEKTSVGEV